MWYTSDSTSRMSSPAEGRSLQPIIPTGMLGQASLIVFPFSSNIKRTFAQLLPATRIEPFLKVPLWIKAVVTGLKGK